MMTNVRCRLLASSKPTHRRRVGPQIAEILGVSESHYVVTVATVARSAGNKAYITYYTIDKPGFDSCRDRYFSTHYRAHVGCEEHIPSYPVVYWRFSRQGKRAGCKLATPI